MEHARRVLGFSLLPAMSMLAPLVILPTVATKYGPEGWSAIALGQSIGALVGVVVALAWPIVGGHQIAVTPERVRAGVFVQSVASRLLALAAVLPLALALVLILGGALWVETALFLVGVALNGLTASWYFAGTGDPSTLVRNEGFVRLLSYAVSAVAMGLGAPLIFYAATTVVAGVGMLLANWRSIVGRPPRLDEFRLRESWELVRRHSYGLLSRALQSAFSFGGVSLCAAFAPGSLGAFAAADQIAKAAINAGHPLSASFVGWVSGNGDLAQRGRKATAIVCVIALCGSAVWVVVGRLVIDVMFAGVAGIDFSGIVLVGLIFLGNVVARAFELLIVVPGGRESLVYSANMVVSAIGLVGLPFAFIVFGAVGGLMVYAGVSIVLVGVYVLGCVRLGL